ncbi:hypothetical protein [Jannaschia sp. R86511]|uniref:hypothetical protein n=1 Tax=Jannaschia sp. R86511 TaxID=3093853 RepID=UPI0036D2C488
MAEVERWSLEHHGRSHVVLVEASGWGRRLQWRVDGGLVAERRTSDEKVHLAPGGDAPADAGALVLRFGWVGPARRVTLFGPSDDLDASARALVGVGGVDLRPDPGSPAARRQAWIATHPRLHTARQTAVAVAAVVVPLLLTWLLARFAFSLPWPDWDLPRIPWPDIPWPQIPWPRIPWPDITWPRVPWPDVSLPWWVEEALSYARYVVPVAIAFALARREVRRHRAAQDQQAGPRPTGPRTGTTRTGTTRTEPTEPTEPKEPTGPTTDGTPDGTRPG